MAQMVKNLPAMQETWVWSLGREDPLEKGMATHSSIPAWRISWTEEPEGLQSMQSQEFNRTTQFWLDFRDTHNMGEPHWHYAEQEARHKRAEDTVFIKLYQRQIQPRVTGSGSVRGRDEVGTGPRGAPEGWSHFTSWLRWCLLSFHI